MQRIFAARLLASFVFALASASLVSAGHPLVANEGQTLCWFDAEGQCIEKVKLTGAPHDIHVLEDGNILTHQHTEIVELDAESKEIVWKYDARKLSDVKRVELHSIARLPDGNLMVALSGQGTIYEIDRSGKVARQFDLKRDHPHPHRDTRLVRPIVDGDNWTYLVAQEGDGYVREYDRDGKIVWEFDVPLFGKEKKGGHGPEAFGDSVFAALRLENGNTLIATGNGHSLLEVTPAKEIVWKVEQNDLPGITLAWVTTLQLMPNGNIVLGNCHAGEGQPQIIEINREKEVVWSLMDFEHLGNSVSNSVVMTK
ncbi:beta-propeller domain-containing protein [Roseiconus lacunae]|uniref:beta-propeller domain-containing protein n=1 Tax=Roseiconus lacunae TaxID=2605694 RepID=UPI001E449723|nr:PQQ-binding-like beta-propeller repeat protein [Roseiconus lacunae]MCD0462218.1 PQQ-binding-like beta-propeller repeat protein [Roseiconus lacunae]